MNAVGAVTICTVFLGMFTFVLFSILTDIAVITGGSTPDVGGMFVTAYLWLSEQVINLYEWIIGNVGLLNIHS